jgi:hypothetical protein
MKRAWEKDSRAILSDFTSLNSNRYLFAGELPDYRNAIHSFRSPKSHIVNGIVDNGRKGLEPFFAMCGQEDLTIVFTSKLKNGAPETPLVRVKQTVLRFVHKDNRFFSRRYR